MRESIWWERLSIPLQADEVLTGSPLPVVFGSDCGEPLSSHSTNPRIFLSSDSAISPTFLLVPHKFLLSGLSGNPYNLHILLLPPHFPRTFEPKRGSIALFPFKFFLSIFLLLPSVATAYVYLF